MAIGAAIMGAGRLIGGFVRKRVQSGKGIIGNFVKNRANKPDGFIKRLMGNRNGDTGGGFQGGGFNTPSAGKAPSARGQEPPQGGLTNQQKTIGGVILGVIVLIGGYLGFKKKNSKGKR